MNWSEVQAKLEANAGKLWSLSEMERTGGEPDVIGHDPERANTSSLIVRRKVPAAGSAFAMIAKDGSRGRNIDRRTPPSIWPPPSGSSF